MDRKHIVRPALEALETRDLFAADIGEPYENARQWRLNDSIPGRAYAAIVRAAAARDFPVTHEQLCGFAEAKHAERQGVA